MGMETTAKQRLKPKKIYRVKPRVCATCAHCEVETFEDGEPCGTWSCKRPGGPSFDVGDGYQWFTTCDGYKSDITKF